MGIMNKMKTVDLGTLTWTKGGGSGVVVFYASISGKKGNANMFCDRYATRNTYWQGLQDKEMTFNATYEYLIYVRDDAFTDATSFKESLQGVILTYETINSVEEKIAGLKDYVVIKIDDTYNWRKSSNYYNTYTLYNSDVNPKPKDSVWQVASTRLYRSPWIKDGSSADIGTLNNGVYTSWTSTLYATVLSCNTLDEFKAYIKEHPIVIGYPTANGTHTSTLTLQTEEII